MTFTPLGVTYGLCKVGVMIGAGTGVPLAPPGDFSFRSAKSGVAAMLESMDSYSFSYLFR